MSNETRLRQALSNLLDAYAACNGDDHPACLEAEAVLNGKKTRQGDSGPSIIIINEARGSGDGDCPLLPPKPVAASLVPDTEPNSMTIRSADFSKPVDRLATLDEDFDQASVSRFDSGLEADASGSSAEFVDNEVLQQQLELLGFRHAHCGIFQLRGSKIKTAQVDCTETRISPSPESNLRVTDLHVEAAKLALVKHSVLMPTDAAIRDMLAAAASLNVPPATNVPPVADLIERAFEIGFCWRSQLIGQTLEDSRAVGRTLESYIFEGLNVYLDHFNSFESSDAGIVEAKKRIIAALRSQTPPPQTRALGTAPVDNIGDSGD